MTWVYYNGIPLYPIFDLLKGGYTASVMENQWEGKREHAMDIWDSIGLIWLIVNAMALNSLYWAEGLGLRV